MAMRWRYVILTFAAIVLIGGAWTFVAARTDCAAVTGTDFVTLSLARLARGDARIFCYTDDAGQRLRFVLARGQDGQVRSVFDACRQCFTYHRGFKIDHGDLVCRVCGNRYPMNQITQGKASCVPVSLVHEQVGDSVRIRVPDIKSGKALF